MVSKQPSLLDTSSNKTHLFYTTGSYRSKRLTCVCDTVVLALSAHVIDDNDPDQWGSNHTAHHHNHHNAHSGPAVLVIPCTRIAVWWWWDAEVDVATLCSQSIRHDAGVFPSISRTCIYYDKKLVGGSKEVALCEDQRSVIFGPVETGGWAASSYTLKHSSFTTGHCSVFQWPHEGWSFWRRGGIIDFLFNKDFPTGICVKLFRWMCVWSSLLFSVNTNVSQALPFWLQCWLYTSS